jgi:glycosyltransferase involved in cell wall biosynthesis
MTLKMAKHELKACMKNSILKSLLVTIEMYLHHKLLYIYDLVDVFISPSRFLKAKIEEMGFKGRVEYLPNFVNLEEYMPRYESSENAIVYFGRISKEKGIATLIEAVKGLDVNLKIIGEGPLRESLERGAGSLESGGSSSKPHTPNPTFQIQFLGYMSGEKLKDEIRNALCVVVPSEWYENNPRSVIEAFALGKPVIGARIGGIPELVKDGETGYTFTSGDVNDLREKIEKLLNDREAISRMGRNGRAFVERDLNEDVHYAKLMEIYQYAIDKNKKARR